MTSLRAVETWSDEADVVIVGLGMAGAVAAIEARAQAPDADVLVLEKMPERYVGGNGRASGQTLYCPHNLEALMRYQQSMNHPNPVPEPVLQAWAEAMVSQEPYIEDIAREAGMEYIHRGRVGKATVIEFPELGGTEAVDYNSTIDPNPCGVWNAFKAKFDSDPPRVRFETPVIDLIQDPDTREVFGVMARIGGREVAVKARRGVILCCGGYENDLDMQRNYHGIDRAYPMGTPGNTGDGIRMLQRAGAELWHMKNQTQSGGLWPAIKVEEYQTAFMRNLRMESGSWFDIARDGGRYYNETERYALTHYKERVSGTWLDTPLADVLPVHMIFDEKTRKTDCLVTQWMTWNTCVEGYVWSEDNSAELKKGWIVQADTLDELASRIGRPADGLKSAVSDFNAACGAGNPDRFGRDPETMQRLEGPPYYALEIVAGIVCTTGGGKRNEHSQVLDSSDQPIPRLYEAGELGSTMANLYQNGSFLTECMVFGRIAARHALGLDAWRE